MDYRATESHPNDVVVDLSQHINKLMAYEDISDDLTEEQELRLVDYVRAILKMSHNQISRRYDQWKQADRAHDVYVPAEATRFREKAVIADTRAIADTVLTYLMAALGGRNPMFQLEGLNRNSRVNAAILERLLHQHMRRTAGEAHLAQLLLDSTRYGFAPTKVVWNPNTNTNTTVNFDPRRVFPDPRVRWGDWDKMQFIGFTDFASTGALLSTNLYPKLNKYPQLRRRLNQVHAGWECHSHIQEESRGLSVNPQQANDESGAYHFNLDRARVVDEIWLRLNGYEINVPQIQQVWLVCTIIDEQVVIRFQLNPNGQQFPTVIGGLFFDKHKNYSQSLYDLLMPLHEIGTWLLRSRIDNVQAALNNLIFVDPTAVSIPDLVDRNPWGVVRTLPGTKPGEGVYIAQVPDVTKGHWNDIAAMSDMKQRLSAASDAQQGLPTADGVRTATEIQRMTQLGSQRLGVLARILSATTIRPYVRMQIANLQDALDNTGSIRLDTDDQLGILTNRVKEGYIDFDTPDLQGDIDYLVVDGTLPVEPTRNADTWMNMLQILSQTGLNMEYKMSKIAEEAIRAMGVSDLEQFKISPEERNQGPSPSQQMAMMEKMRGASVQSGQDIESQVQKGNLVPMSEAS